MCVSGLGEGTSPVASFGAAGELLGILPGLLDAHPDLPNERLETGVLERLAKQETPRDRIILRQFPRSHGPQNESGSCALEAEVGPEM